MVSGLGSIANEGTGEFGIGPSDVAFAGKTMFVTEGLGLDLEFSNTVPELATWASSSRSARSITDTA